MHVNSPDESILTNKIILAIMFMEHSDICLGVIKTKVQELIITGITASVGELSSSHCEAVNIISSLISREHGSHNNTVNLYSAISHSMGRLVGL